MAKMPYTTEMGAMTLLQQAAAGSVVTPDWRMGRSIPVPKVR